MELVTLSQVDYALRLDLSENDERIPDVELKIAQAEAIVIDYIKRPDHEWTVETVPGGVSAAVILVVKSLFDDSGKAEMIGGLQSNDPTSALVALLWPHRDPALA